MNDHARASELLVWMVNGRIEAADARWLDEHLEHCAACRDELRAEQRVRDAIAREPTVEFAPQASFNRLWERIESARDATTADAMPPDATAPVMPGHGSAGEPAAKRGDKVRWLRVAVTAQAAVILLLCGILWQRPTAPAYRTVTDAAPAPAVAGGVIKAIFSDQVRLADVKEILQGAGLAVVSGPSAAGVYTLAPRDSLAPPVTPEVAARLRADPRVRFAEIGAQ